MSYETGFTQGEIKEGNSSWPLRGFNPCDFTNYTTPQFIPPHLSPDQAVRLRCLEMVFTGPDLADTYSEALDAARDFADFVLSGKVPEGEAP